MEFLRRTSDEDLMSLSGAGEGRRQARCLLGDSCCSCETCRPSDRQLHWRSRVRISRPTMLSLWHWLLALLLLTHVQPSVQVLEFLQQPAATYYILNISNAVAIIPCHIVETLPPDDTQLSIDPTFYINSVPLNPYTPPPRYGVQLEGGVMVGLVISPVLQQDNDTVIQCGVDRQGGETLRSRNSTIRVGDGRPLPPTEPPYQTSETILSTTLEWGVSLSPSHAPILNYSLTYWLQEQLRDQAITMDTPDNETTVELTSLQPGGTYKVVVRGRNSIGLGEESAPGVVMMMRGEVPLAPTDVVASVELNDGQFKAFVTVSWTAVTIDPEIMTPVENYLIFLTNSSSLSASPSPEAQGSLMATVGSDITTHTLTVRESGRYSVGVVARNRAGQSEEGTYDQELDIQLLPPPTTEPTTPTTSETEGPSTASQTTDSSVTDTTGQTTNTPPPSPNTSQTTDTTDMVTVSPTTSADTFTALTEEQNSDQPVITIIAVVVVGSLVLVILSVLIFLMIFYLRVKIRKMNMESYNMSNASSESPPLKKESETKSHVTNGASGTEMHFATLPSKFSHREHNGNRSTDGLIEEENRYQSLPMLTTKEELEEQKLKTFSIPLSELGTRC